MVKEFIPFITNNHCSRFDVEQSSLWYNCILIALGVSFCNSQENFIIMLPLLSDHWNYETTTFFKTIPYKLCITSITILFIGLLLNSLHILTKRKSINNNSTINNNNFLTNKIQSITINSQNSRSEKINHLQLLFIIYIIVAFLAVLIEYLPINISITFKESIYAINIGVITFTGLLAISIFPPAYACITYALAIIFNSVFYEVTLYFDKNFVLLFKSVAPFVTIPIFIIGIPKKSLLPTYIIFQNTPVSLKQLFSSKRTLKYVVLCLLVLLATFQFFLNAVSTTEPSILETEYISITQYKILITFCCHVISAIFVIWTIKSKNNAHLILLLFILGLVGIGTILHSILIKNTIPLIILQIASGLITAVCIITLSILVHSQQYTYNLLGIAIFLMNIVGYFSGYILWNISLFVKNYSISFIQTPISILGIIAVLSIFFIHLLEYHLTDISHICHLLNLHSTSIEAYIYENRIKQLTPREKEILSLVQQGLKNIEISSRLRITEATLRVHLRNTYRKLNIKGRQTLKSLPYNPSIHVES